MKQINYFLLFVLLIGCKKENTSIKKLTKVIETKMDNHDLTKQTIDSVLLLNIQNKSIIAFYKSLDNKTVWNLSKNRNELIEEIKKSYLEGLSPNDYGIKKLEAFEDKSNSLSKNEIIEYDLLLTNSFYKYISDLANGKLNPKKLYNNWDLKPNSIAIDTILFIALKENKINNALQKNKPHYIVYNKLKDALVAIDSYPDDNSPSIEIKEKKIVLNDTSESIIPIKKRLIYWNDLKTSDSLTTIYDEKTLIAVKKFQNRHGLQDDGVIGAGTIVALNISKEKRKEQIIANLERWRWFPRNMGDNYLIINIPDYTLHVIKGDDTIRTHKVIVGTAKRNTPVLSSKLNYIVYNPTWTVPPTILKEDLIPATSKNTGYLGSKNITIYDKNNNLINVINWKSENARSYRYVQSPGDYNSLGRVKIIFANPFLVYLHDTNNRSLFNKSNRSISSGCVRVENPMELTEYLLSDEVNWTQEKTKEILETKKTKNVNIKNDIYIHILYWTAWIDSNELQFRDDIYKLDAELYKKLRQ